MDAGLCALPDGTLLAAAGLAGGGISLHPENPDSPPTIVHGLSWPAAALDPSHLHDLHLDQRLIAGPDGRLILAGCSSDGDRHDWVIVELQAER
jgi:hypothetical protein